MPVARLTAKITIGIICVAVTAEKARTADPDISYFPSADQWQTVDASTARIDFKALDRALDFAMSRQSSSVVILLNGRILAERHASVKTPSKRYQAMLHGKTTAGHIIEDVASVQKSVVSVLASIALQKKLFKLSDPVSQHLGKGWSNASPLREEQISIRHLITMTSGLNERLNYAAPAGSKWQYNTSAYSKTLSVICKVTGKSPNEITSEWLTGPLGMKNTRWIERPVRGLSTEATNKYGFTTSARDLARFGLLVLNEGKWDDQVICSNKNYLRRMSEPSQKLNPSYGYLWWLNGQEFVLRGNKKVDSHLIPTAPKDLFAAQGALGRKCYVVPSANLVVTRLGDDPDAGAKLKFNSTFWQLLKKAATK